MDNTDNYKHSNFQKIWNEMLKVKSKRNPQEIQIQYQEEDKLVQLKRNNKIHQQGIKELQKQLETLNNKSKQLDTLIQIKSKQAQMDHVIQSCLLDESSIIQQQQLQLQISQALNIANMPILIYQKQVHKNIKCKLCNKKLVQNDQFIELPCCQKSYHQHCLVQYVTMLQHCPFCRKKIVKIQN